MMKTFEDLKIIYQKNPYFKQISATNCLDELKEILITDKNLRIAKLATNPVFSSGDFNAKLMLVGEAPGRDEDKTSVPFCGRSGKYLNELLKSVGILRDEQTYVTNAVNWRPDNNRIPTEDEILYCLPYLEKHIELQNPQLIVTFGSTATFALLNRSSKPSTVQVKPLITKTFRYKNFFSCKDFPLFVMYHPSYMMRNYNMETDFKSHFSKLKIEVDKFVSVSS